MMVFSCKSPWWFLGSPVSPALIVVWKSSSLVFLFYERRRSRHRTRRRLVNLNFESESVNARHLSLLLVSSIYEQLFLRKLCQSFDGRKKTFGEWGAGKWARRILVDRWCNWDSNILNLKWCSKFLTSCAILFSSFSFFQVTRSLSASNAALIRLKLWEPRGWPNYVAAFVVADKIQPWRHVGQSSRRYFTLGFERLVDRYRWVQAATTRSVRIHEP